jgi:hypothetical protein
VWKGVGEEPRLHSHCYHTTDILEARSDGEMSGWGSGNGWELDR